MQDKISRLFSSDSGRRIYESALQAIKACSMDRLIFNGVLVGLSGGADSVMLLCFLVEYRKHYGEFPLLAVHVNHGIRGKDADMDEIFSKNLCCELGVDFLSKRIDVPTQAKLDKIGTEECARNMRYLEFDKIISGREDIDCIAVAHNADDNLETVLLNILRGSGSRGAAGIPPIRDNIVRPLIKVTKQEIVDALNSADIPYVTDITNFSNDYKRNFIRNEIAPKLAELSKNPALMVGRMSDNLRSDDDFINICALEFIDSHDKILNYELLALHKSLRARVITKMTENKGISLSSVNFDNLYELLKNDNFSYSLPGNYVFKCERGICSVICSDNLSVEDYCIPVFDGKNVITKFDSEFYISRDRLDKSSLNIYKLSIQADISSAIIEGELYLRPKKDGDTVFYGGMTHKMKKLYNDRKIPISVRPFIPLLCDDKGVVWAPGFGVRDDRGENRDNFGRFATLCIGLSDEFCDLRFYSGSEFR